MGQTVQRDKPAARPRMSDEAVRAKTGKTWAEWFALLDAAGAAKMSHREIVAYLHNEHGVGPWWQQMVTVTYEQARGLRAKHETPSGYQISRSKTLAVPAGKAFAAWKDRRTRARWLKDADLVIRTSTPDKSLRITWGDGKTSLEVNLYPKGEDRCQVSVQHNKLADAEAAERMKAYWADALDALQKVLEK
jgi:uncharacterized protein YndB with AHSA1/START domain